VDSAPSPYGPNEAIYAQEKSLKSDLSDRLSSLLELSRSTVVEPRVCIQQVYDSMDALKLSGTLNMLLRGSFSNVELTTHEQAINQKFPLKTAYLYLQARFPLFITRNYELVEDAFISTPYYKQFKRYLSDFIGKRFEKLVRIEGEEIYSNKPLQCYSGQPAGNYFVGFIILEQKNPLALDINVATVVASEIVQVAIVIPTNKKARINVTLRPGDLLIIRGSDAAKFKGENNFKILYFAIL
jgi:hypothetical protein